MKKIIPIAAMSILLLSAIQPAIAETAASGKSMPTEKSQKAERARKAEKRESPREPEQAEKRGSTGESGSESPAGASQKSIEENGSTEHQSSCYSHPWLCQ